MQELDVIRSDTGKVFTRYLIPGLLSMLAVSCYSFVDTFVVGQANGSLAVAAMGVGTPVVSLLYATGFLIGAGGAVRYSIAGGTGYTVEAQGIYRLSLRMTILCGVLFAAAGNLLLRPIAVFLGASPANLALSMEYLRWIFTFAPFLIMDLVMGSFMRNDGHPTVAAIATMVGTGVNILLDFLFVLVFRWGMSGAAGATCLASVLSVAINCGFTFSPKSGLKPAAEIPQGGQTLLIRKNGAGSFVLEAAIAVITVCFVNAGGRWFGDDGVSAYTVVMTLNLVVYSVLNGVAQTMQPLVSANHGAGRPERVKAFFRDAVVAGALIGAGFFCLAEAVPAFLASCFLTDSAAALGLAVKAIRLHAVSFVLMGVSMQIGIYFQAIERAGEAFVILLGRSFLFPVVTLLAAQGLAGGTAVWISVPIGEALALALSLAILKRSKDS